MSEEGGEKVPLWIISFADMITLLLAFFVMLQTMAHSRDNGLMRGTQRGFNTALRHMGLPDFLFGEDDNREQMDYRRLKYPDEPDPKKPDAFPSVDPKEVKMEEVYSNIIRTMETQLQGEQTKWLATFPVTAKFPAHSANLPPAAKDVLRQVAEDIASNTSCQTIEIVILASAPEESDPSAQWQLSAMRAATINNVLAQTFKEADLTTRRISTLPWGCGDGGMIHELVSDNGQCQAVIVAIARLPE